MFDMCQLRWFPKSLLSPMSGDVHFDEIPWPCPRCNGFRVLRHATPAGGEHPSRHDTGPPEVDTSVTWSDGLEPLVAMVGSPLDLCFGPGPNDLRRRSASTARCTQVTATAARGRLSIKHQIQSTTSSIRARRPLEESRGWAL